MKITALTSCCVDLYPDACTMSAEEIDRLVRAFNHPRAPLRHLVQEPNLKLKNVKIIKDLNLAPGETKIINNHEYIGTKDKTLQLY